MSKILGGVMSWLLQRPMIYNLVAFSVSMILTVASFYICKGVYAFPMSILVGCSSFVVTQFIEVIERTKNCENTMTTVTENLTNLKTSIHAASDKIDACTHSSSSVETKTDSALVEIRQGIGYLSKIENENRGRVRAIDEFRTILCDTSEAFDEIVKQENWHSATFRDDDVFARQLFEEARRLRQTITKFRDARSMIVTQNHIRKANEIRTLIEGLQEPAWRFLWVLSTGGNEGPLDPPAWNDFFQTMVEFAATKSNFKIETVIVSDASIAASQGWVKKIMEFYESRPNFGLVVLDKRSFEKKRHNTPGLQNCEDFALFGSSLVYLARHYEPILEAEYSRDPECIKEYRGIFDSLYGGAARYKIALEQKSGTQVVSVQDLVATFGAG